MAVRKTRAAWQRRLNVESFFFYRGKEREIVSRYPPSVFLSVSVVCISASASSVVFLRSFFSALPHDLVSAGLLRKYPMFTIVGHEDHFLFLRTTCFFFKFLICLTKLRVNVKTLKNRNGKYEGMLHLSWVFWYGFATWWLNMALHKCGFIFNFLSWNSLWFQWATTRQRWTVNCCAHQLWSDLAGSSFVFTLVSGPTLPLRKLAKDCVDMSCDDCWMVVVRMKKWKHKCVRVHPFTSILYPPGNCMPRDWASVCLYSVVSEKALWHQGNVGE